MFVTGPTSHNKDYYWLLSHSKKFKNIEIIDVTKQYGCLSIMGPNSREHLQRICNLYIPNKHYRLDFQENKSCWH